MTTEYGESGQQRRSRLTSKCTDEMIIEVVSQAPFISHAELADLLGEIDSERLEEIAKNNPSIMHTIYDILLFRATQIDKVEPQKINSMVYTDFSTPNTPYSMWSRDILRFTTIDLKSAQKLSALLRRKYNEVKPHEIMDLLRKLEHMCIGSAFTAQEKTLSLALLNIAVREGNISPRYILHFCSLMKCMQYLPADSTLLEYFEREDMSTAEEAVISAIKEKRVQSHWVLKQFLQAHSERVLSIFYKIKEDLIQYIKENEVERAVLHLTPLYMYSQAEETEECIFSEFKENRNMLKEMCQEQIWN
ncbi:hypothetical protein NEIG_01100 [Nematocida sp. ERTm5]|nr:hypothetical protein NEIG_01100 [Nematocida sp. ERTm5]